METPPPPVLPNPDEEHLKLLAIFHYVVAAIGALFACLPLIHVSLGIMMVTRPEFMTAGQKGVPPPAWFGYFFIININSCNWIIYILRMIYWFVSSIAVNRIAGILIDK